MRLFGTAYSFFPTTNKSGWPSHINSHVLCKLSLVFVPPDKATGSTLCVARGQLCRGSSVGIQATEEMATTIGRPVHVTCEWWSSKSVQIDNQESCLNARRKSFLRAESGGCLCLCHFFFLSYGRYDDYYGGSRGKVNLGSGEQLKLTFYQILWKGA